MNSVKKFLGVAILSMLLSVTAFGGDMLGGFVGDNPLPPGQQQAPQSVVSNTASESDASDIVGPVTDAIIALQSLLSLF